MFCAACAVETTDVVACSHCGQPPQLRDGVGHSWRLESVVGQGGVGTTWRAVDSAGAVVAIKEIPLRHLSDAKARELVEREARVLRELTHPGVPRFIAAFRAGAGRARAVWLVQELIAGPSLAEELLQRRYSVADVLDILDEVLGIVTWLHTRSPPVVHRDLKPANIVRRGPGGALALVDFGSVRDAVHDSVFGGSTVAGTFGYMAPEQFRGEAGPAADLYGAACTAVALLTREEPRVLLEGIGRLQWEGRVSVSGPVRDVLRQMLATDPGDRPPSADHARRLLAAARETPSVGAPIGLEPTPVRQLVAPREPSETDAAVQTLLLGDGPAAPPAVRPDASVQARQVRSLMLGVGIVVMMLLGVLVGILASGSAVKDTRVTAAPPVVEIEAGDPLWQDFNDLIWHDTTVSRCVRERQLSSPNDDLGSGLLVIVEISPPSDMSWTFDAGAYGGSELERCVLVGLESLRFHKQVTVETPTIVQLPHHPYPQLERRSDDAGTPRAPPIAGRESSPME